MTRDEFEALLEEAFIEGYNDAIDEIFEEDNTFDLEDEYDYYNESKNVRKRISELNTSSNPEKYAYYRNGVKGDDNNPKGGINKGRDWANNTTCNNTDPINNHKWSNMQDFVVRNTDKGNHNSKPLGRIKVRDLSKMKEEDMTWDDIHKLRHKRYIKNKIKKNKERYEERMRRMEEEKKKRFEKIKPGYISKLK